MSLLATVGTFSYNGFTFNSSTRTIVRGKPLYDQADRTVVAVVYTITAVTIIQAVSISQPDTAMLDAHQRLTKAGQELRFTSQGFAALSINVTSVKDVMWGPKPRVIDCRPIGSSQAWELVWTCEVAIPMCTTAKYELAVMAFNYEVDFSVDADGYSSRVVSGYLEIPLTRSGGGHKVVDNADAYWEKIYPDGIPGFQRKERSRKLSMDRRRLDFHIVDEQIRDGSFPAGTTHFKGTHTTTTDGVSWLKFHSTLNATYRVPPGEPRSKAADAFFDLLMDRAMQSDPKDRIFLSFNVSEGLGENRDISFSCAWTFCSNVADCMAAGGHWRALPKTNWDKWIKSTGVKEAVSARGLSGLIFNNADDSIIDLCIGSVSKLTRRGSDTITKLRHTSVPGIKQNLKAENSWLRYRAKIIVLSIPSTARLKLLPTSKTPSNNGMGETESTLTNTFESSFLESGLADAVSGAIAGADETGSGRIASETNWTPDTIQVRATGTYRVALVGEAIRAGYKIPLPQLITFAGVTVTPAKQEASTDYPIANWSGIPVYARQFRLEYDLDEAPDNATVSIPGNPAIQVEN